MSNRIALWFFKGLLTGPDRDEFYEVLGVTKKAEISEIRRAYRSKCLEVHPDKLRQRGIEVTDEHRHRYQKIQRAGEVLSDPQKRELYDQLGETGMKILEEPSNVSLEKIVNNFLKMRNKERLKLIMLVILIVVGAILLFPILLCAKIDGELASSSWTALWTPIWMYDAIGLYYLGYIVSLGNFKPPEGLEDDWVDTYPLKNRIFNLALFCIFILQQIFLTLRLDNVIGWNWLYVLMIALIYSGIKAFTTTIIAIQRQPKIDEIDLEEGINEEYMKKMAHKVSILKARGQMNFDVTQLLQLVMIILKLDDVVDWSWWVVFWPIYVYLMLNLSTQFLHCSMGKKILADLPKTDESLSEQDAEKAELGKQLIGNAASGVFVDMIKLLFVLLAVAKIAGADFSMFIIFIPLFAASGCLICCMSCFICCARGDLDDLNLDEESNKNSADKTQNSQSEYGTYGGSAAPGEEAYIPPPAELAYIPPVIKTSEAPPPKLTPVTRIDSDID